MSSETSETVIFSDEDTDGMCATRIIHNALTKLIPDKTHTIMWQTWDIFGMNDGNVVDILEKKPKTVFILDLGSGMGMLNQAMALLANGVNVVILDNHPPDVEVEGNMAFHDFQITLTNLREKFALLRDKALPYFYYESSNENCTTGVAYNYAKRSGWSVANMEKWALLGLEGDVASNTKEGGVLFQTLLESHPHLRGLLVSKALHSTYDWSLLAFYTQLLHNPRRMIFNEAPPICYEAMKEMEQNPNWLKLYEYVNKDAKGTLPKIPATKTLVDLTIAYRKGKGEPEERGNYTQLDFPDFGVNIINHKWNIGSALCNKYSNNNKKTWFVINDIPNYGIHVSGRGSPNGLHIGKVFRLCNPKIMEGGGIRPAGSAHAHVQNTEIVLDELVRAVGLSKK